MGSFWSFILFFMPTREFAEACFIGVFKQHQLEQHIITHRVHLGHLREFPPKHEGIEEAFHLTRIALQILRNQVRSPRCE